MLRELRRGAGDSRPLAVAGSSELVPELARRLREGGDAGAVVVGSVAGCRGARLGRADRRGEAPDGDAVEGADRRSHRGSVRPVRARRLRGSSAGRGGLSARRDRRRDRARARRRGCGARRAAAGAAAGGLRPADRGVREEERRDRGRGVRPGRRPAAADDEPDPARAAHRARPRRGARPEPRPSRSSAVVGAGYGFRMLAREALDLVPGRGLGGEGRRRLQRARARSAAAAVRLCEARSTPSYPGAPSGRGPRLQRTDWRWSRWRWPATRKHRAAADRGGRRVVRVLSRRRAASPQTRYGELEPWAWARLSQRLRAIRARRARLQPAIEAGLTVP